MKTTFFAIFLLLSAHFAHTQESLTIEDCRRLAVENNPLQARKGYADQTSTLQNESLKRNNLPRIGVNAQASWQTDVFKLPFDNPAFAAPDIPKDQYKATLDVSQRIWDGGYDNLTAQQQVLNSALTAAQTDVDAFGLRETVTDLYFNILLLQESEQILLSSRQTLEQRLRQSEAQVEQGVALRTSADQVRIQIQQHEQQIAANRIDQQTLKQVLGTWIGKPDGIFSLQSANISTTFVEAATDRPEYALLDVQKKLIDLQNEALRLRLQPRVEAFGQGGMGRPNPLNFFETDFQPFAMLGVRAAWTPVDWGNSKRQQQVLSLQALSLDAQRASLDQRIAAYNLKDRGNAAKAGALLQQDDAIIALQEDIVQRADAQVQNGVMTTTDYLAQVNLLTQARLTRKTHEIQALQAIEMYKARNGQ
ncbi:MAG: TolC family protein [Saprospiraceae bacterium]